MKDTVILEHKIFISVRRAVQISGYASDYVGQLCREGKLECKMLGKSWFLTEESILNYRQSIKQELPPSQKVENLDITHSDPSPLESDSIILDRKNFISAKRAAEVSGYTSDYVGQLCRSEKLESRRVGKAWFVSEKSLLSHCISSAQVSDVSENKVIEQKLPAVSDISIIISQTSDVDTSKNITKVGDERSFEVIRKISKSISQSSVLSNSVSNSSVVTLSESKLNLFAVSHLSKISFIVVTSLVSFIILFQLLSLQKISSKSLSTSIISSTSGRIDATLSFLSSIPKLVLNIFTNTSDIVASNSMLSDVQSNTSIKKVESPPPALLGLAVTASSNNLSQDELLKEKIKSSFSDEVQVKPDKSGTAGIITPVFKKTKGDNFVYVLVPVKNQ